MARFVQFGHVTVNLDLVRDATDLEELGITGPDAARLQEYLECRARPWLLRVDSPDREEAPEAPPASDDSPPAETWL